MNSVQNRTGDDTPGKLQDNEIAKAFYGVVKEPLEAYVPDKGNRKELSAEIGLKLDEIINQNKIVDWQEKEDVINKIKQNIEDYIYEKLLPENIDLGWDKIDDIIEKTIEIAKRRY